jgi:hypothetical protein
MAALPLLIDDEVMSAVVIDSADPDSFGEEEFNLRSGPGDTAG